MKKFEPVPNLLLLYLFPQPQAKQDKVNENYQPKQERPATGAAHHTAVSLVPTIHHYVCSSVLIISLKTWQAT